jgi:D-aminoacyl-tRNA deacylase
MILLVASERDVAGLNIKAQILKHYSFKETGGIFQQNPTFAADFEGKKVTLITLNQEAVNAQDLPKQCPDAELIIFISRHSSQSGRPTLTVHTPGNLSEAQLGGLSKTVSVCPATAMQDALKTLSYYKEKLSLNYEVSYECTHHGPSLDVPTIFVELGSCEKQWVDALAAEAVAHAAVSAISNFGNSANSAVLGIGGTHYNEKFTRLALEGKAVFSHMIPKYAVANTGSEMLSQCKQKTLEKVACALLDWKGIRSEDKPKLLSDLSAAGLDCEKI